MSVVVLDASVVLKWVSATSEPGHVEAAELEGAFLRRELDVVVPTLLALEVLNIAGRRWRFSGEDLAAVAAMLESGPWTVEDPPLAAIPPWVERGLTAYDATYVALADRASCAVVTTDEQMLAVAGPLATPLVP